MPRPAGLSRYTVYGDMAGGEIWNTSFWMDGVYDDEGAAGDGIAAVVGYWTTDMQTRVSAITQASTRWLGIRLYEYPDGGDAPAARVTDGALGTPAVGTASGNGMLQTALVCTLLTGFSGRRNRGRMYLPATGLACNNGLAQSNTPIDNCALWLAQFFSDVNGSANVSGQAVVVSIAGSAARPITAVAVDNKPDIQRRRADALTATHIAHNDLP